MLALRKIYIQYRGISTVQIPTKFWRFCSYLKISLPTRALAKLQILPTFLDAFLVEQAKGLKHVSKSGNQRWALLKTATGPGYPSLCNSFPMDGRFSTIAEEKSLELIKESTQFNKADNHVGPHDLFILWCGASSRVHMVDYELVWA